MKKITALAVAVLLLLSSVPAAAGTAKNAARETAEKYGLPLSGMEDMEPIEFTYFDRTPNEPYAEGNRIIEAIETITNVTIKPEFLVGEIEQKIGVMIASGDMPDAVFVGGLTGRFIDAGSFVPLDELIEEYAPHLREHFDPWWERMKHEDGHIYIAEAWGTPSGIQNQMETWGTAFWLQKDVLDHFGRAPETLDEYFDFIREYKELYPTIDGVPTTGFEAFCERGRDWGLANPPLFLAGYPNWGFPYVDEASETTLNRFTADFTKPYYQKLNEEFNLGTIDAESVTLTFDQYIAKIASGAVLGFSDQKWSFNSAQDLLRAEGKDNRTYLPIPLTYEGVEEHRYMDAPAFAGNNGVGISINCKDPERLVRYMDYLIQEEVQRFMVWGIEGEHWYFNDEGRIERPDEQRVLQQDNRWRIDNLGTMLRDWFPKLQGTYADGNSTDLASQPEEYFAGLRDYDKELFEKLDITFEAGFMGPGKENPVYYPVWSMTIEDGSPAKVAQTRVEDINLRYLPQLVICPTGEFDALWDEYQAALKKIDLTEYLEEVDRQIQERIKLAQ